MLHPLLRVVSSVWTNVQNSKNEKERMKNISYASIVESLTYAQVSTIPNIAFTMRMLRRYQRNPKIYHWKATKKVMRCLHIDGPTIWKLLDIRTWRNAKLTLMSSSTVKAEFVSYYETTLQGIWLRSFIASFEVVESIFKPTWTYCNNMITMLFFLKIIKL